MLPLFQARAPKLQIVVVSFLKTPGHICPPLVASSVVNVLESSPRRYSTTGVLCADERGLAAKLRQASWPRRVGCPTVVSASQSSYAIEYIALVCFHERPLSHPRAHRQEPPSFGYR